MVMKSDSFQRETDRQSVRHTGRWQFSRLRQVCGQMVSSICVHVEPLICADDKNGLTLTP